MDIRGSLESPEIRARGMGLFGPRAVCVRSLGVSDMWEVRSDIGECVMLRTVKYGEVPKGFVEREPAKPLVAGVTYHASANGSTGAIPNVPFRAYGAFIFQEGRWHRLDTQ